MICLFGCKKFLDWGIDKNQDFGEEKLKFYKREIIKKRGDLINKKVVVMS